MTDISQTVSNGDCPETEPQKHRSVYRILADHRHLPWSLPTSRWKYYQEWKNVLFLHWHVTEKDLEPFVSKDIRPHLLDGSCWVSVVIFQTHALRMRNLPGIRGISGFNQVNIRTYVEMNGKPGVHFLSIEVDNPVASYLARLLSGLPYRTSDIHMSKGQVNSRNDIYTESLSLKYHCTKEIIDRTPLAHELTERYSVIQDIGNKIASYDILHAPWPLYRAELDHFELKYGRYRKLLCGQPDLVHYSPGTEVVAWGLKPMQDLTESLYS